MKYQVAMLSAAVLAATIGANTGSDRHNETAPKDPVSAVASPAAPDTRARLPEEKLFRASDILAYNQLPANHDCAMALAAVNRLAMNAVMVPYPIRVECQAGVMRLSGHVPAPYYCTLAENLVRKISGVYEVQNDLVVAGVGRGTAHELNPDTSWEAELAEKTLAYDLAVKSEISI